MSSDNATVKIKRTYERTVYSDGDMKESMVLIDEFCDSLTNKRRMKRLAFSLDSPYDTICVLAVRNYKFVSDGLYKGESSKKAASRYIKVLKNRSVEWFAR